MGEIMIGMIALIFQGVEIFVFNFPSCPTGFDRFFDIVAGYRDIGNPTNPISHQAF